MKGKINKLNKKDPKKKTIDEQLITDEEAESIASTSSMTDEDFLLEIKEYAKKLNANKKSAEDEDSTISEDNELEIDYLHQVIASLKEQLNAEKEKS